MLASNCHALKEWAVVCAALAAGRQTLLLRKGGIAEGPEGFTARHPEFWLFPTRFHQSADELQPHAATSLHEIQNSAPPAGIIRISLYGVVESVVSVDDVGLLSRVQGEHILSPQTVSDRFHYRRPGLFVLTVRVYRLLQEHETRDEPRYAGCHSWVELTEEFPTADLVPIFSDDDFLARSRNVLAALSE